MRSRSFVSSPVAVATAMRTSASVWGSSPAGCSPLTLTFRIPQSAIVSFREPPIYTHLTHGLAARIADGSFEQRRRLRLETQLGQHRRDRQRRRQAVTVLDLERDAESFANEGGAIDTLRTDLRDHASRMRTHHFRTRSAFTGNQLGVQ